MADTFLNMHQSTLELLRIAVEQYEREKRRGENGRHRDPFIAWFESVQATLSGQLHLRVLLILVNARFDQGTVAENALANTQTVFKAGLLERDNILLENVPPLRTRQRMKPERWRAEFCRALPLLKSLAERITAKRNWTAAQLLEIFNEAKVPFLGPKTTRLAIRWLHELTPEVNVEMSSSEIPVDSLVYRVACRLGILDPEQHRYTGPGSLGHVRIQHFGRILHPHNPSILDEPMWMMGRNRNVGGYCHAKDPRCEAGCTFFSCCPKMWRESDPADVGYHARTQPGARVLTNEEITRTERQAPGLLVIVGCGQRKIWDVDITAPQRVPCDAAYRGSFFRGNRAYARAFGQRWCVLSAKYGFIWPEDEIENYSTTFNKKRSQTVSVPELQHQVRSQRLQDFERVQVLAGREYVDRVCDAFDGTGVRVEAPIAGLGLFAARKMVAGATQTGSPLSLACGDILR